MAIVLVTLVGGSFVFVAGLDGNNGKSAADGGVSQLRRRDEQGAEACDLIREWSLGRLKDEDGKPDSTNWVAVLTGDPASQASTPSIRASLIPSEYPGGPSINFESLATNLEQLKSACIASGVQVGHLPFER